MHRHTEVGIALRLRNTPIKMKSMRALLVFEYRLLYSTGGIML